MRRSFTAAQRRDITKALAERASGAAAAPVPCPACGDTLSESPVAAPATLPYVRSRVMLVCARCELGAAFDVKAAARP